MYAGASILGKITRVTEISGGGKNIAYNWVYCNATASRPRSKNL